MAEELASESTCENSASTTIELQTCVYSEPVLFLSLGRICTWNRCACFNWHKKEAVTTCPILLSQGKEATFRTEFLDLSHDNWEVKLEAFAYYLKHSLKNRS